MQNMVLGAAPSLLITDPMDSRNINRDGIPGEDCEVYKHKQKCMARVFPTRVAKADLQLEIAWFSRGHASVRQLQKLFCDCTVSIGVHLTRATVCYTLLCAERNKFRNLACSSSSAIPYGSDYFRWEIAWFESSMGECPLSMFWLNFHVKCITHWVSVLSSVPCRKFLIKWSVTGSIVGSAHLFESIFGWQNLNGQVLGCTSMVFHYSCFSLVTGACNRAMEFGIQWQFSFVSDKSQATFSAFSAGPVNLFAQWLQSPVQDQVIGLQSVCKLGVQIFSGPSYVKYLLVGVAASVLKKLNIPWLHFLLLDLTSEVRFDLPIFQWEIAWQPQTSNSKQDCYHQVPRGMQAAKFCSVAVLELQGSTYMLFSGGTCQACKVQIYRNFSYSDHFQEGIYFNGKASQHCKIKCDPGDDMFAQCSFDKMCTTLRHSEHFQWPSMRLAYAFWICLVAWTVYVWEISRGCEQAPSQGGRDMVRGAFFDIVCVSHDYHTAFIKQSPVSYDNYPDQASYFDTICRDIIYYYGGYHIDSSKANDVYIPWDPGKLVPYYHPKLRLGDKPDFKERGMLGTYLYTTDTGNWVGLLGWHMGLVQHRPIGDTSYIYWEGCNAQAIQVGSGETAAAPSSHLGSSFPSPFMLFILYQIAIRILAVC
ncbi:uncharacterized protein [Lolium perenne]|uniref:uncharacterized protein n=1 Tax=Lolium perenne TaxID=4522 RepID=UPI0021F50989|nr:uncharacterized protein LOC127318564 [Lolium perenne]